MKICLNMIVKDEAGIIAATLHTYIPHIDYYVICDTGSSDDTIAVIRQVMDDADIPGEIHEFPFNNFEYARNRALEYAQQSQAGFDYILFADADRTIEVQEKDWKQRLSHDCYSAQVYNQNVSYYVVRLIRKSLPCRWQGVTHEKLVHESKVKRHPGLLFREQGTGDSRKGKYQRDVALLSAALQEQPDNRRYWFYLGQSYFNLGEYLPAAEAYSKRAAFGDDSQEVFYALYRLGLCQERLDRWPEALDCYLRSYQRRPSRFEGLYEIARYYRATGNPHLAMLFAERCITAPYPQEDGLFIRDRVYKFGIPYEYAASAIQLGQQARAREVCRQLLDEPSLTGPERKKLLQLWNEVIDLPIEISHREKQPLPAIPVEPAAEGSSQSTDQGITAVLTSCNRPLLLQRTLQSFFRYNEYPLHQFIVIEDGPEIPHQVAAEFADRNITWLATGERVGQIAAIDYAYSHVTTPYIFHLEDDWEFYRSGFLPASLAILQDQPKCLQVWIRRPGDTNKHPVESHIYQSGEIAWRRMAPRFRSSWHGFSFNPGLRRMRDYVAIGGYGHLAKFEFNKPLLAEKAINKFYHQHGFFAAILAGDQGFVRHIGKGEHVGAPVEVK